MSEYSVQLEPLNVFQSASATQFSSGQGFGSSNLIDCCSEKLLGDEDFNDEEYEDINGPMITDQETRFLSNFFPRLARSRRAPHTGTVGHSGGSGGTSSHSLGYKRPI